MKPTIPKTLALAVLVCVLQGIALMKPNRNLALVSPAAVALGCSRKRRQQAQEVLSN